PWPSTTSASFRATRRASSFVPSSSPGRSAADALAGRRSGRRDRALEQAAIAQDGYDVVPLPPHHALVLGCRPLAVTPSYRPGDRREASALAVDGGRHQLEEVPRNETRHRSQHDVDPRRASRRRDGGVELDHETLEILRVVSPVDRTR